MMRANRTNQNRTTSPQTDHGNVPASVMGPRLVVSVSTALLVIIGIVMVLSASSISAVVAGGSTFSEAGRQLAYAAAGVALCVVIARFVPYRAWQGGATWIVFAVSLALLVLTALIGTEEYGAKRWLNIGPVSFQPSEFAKVGILLLMAKLLHDYQDGGMGFYQFIGYFIGLNLVVVGLIFMAQSDLGTTLICFVGIIAILWLAEIPGPWVAGYAAGVFGIGFLGLVTSSYRWARMTAFLHPWDDYYGSGYQLIHSFYAFAQGGLLGTGLGGSAEKYQYLFGAETDFIFSIIGEELGFVGAALVIALFLALLLGGLRMAQAAPDRFGAMLCGSFAVILVFQAFLNIGCTIGALPVTGKPLPFISSGGSSMVVSLAMVGIMLSVSHGSDESPVYRQRREDLRVIPGGRPARGEAGADRGFGGYGQDRYGGAGRGYGYGHGGGTGPDRDRGAYTAYGRAAPDSARAGGYAPGSYRSRYGDGIRLVGSPGSRRGRR